MTQRYNNDVKNVEPWGSFFHVVVVDGSTSSRAFNTQTEAWAWANNLPMRPKPKRQKPKRYYYDEWVSTEIEGGEFFAVMSDGCKVGGFPDRAAMDGYLNRLRQRKAKPVKMTEKQMTECARELAVMMRDTLNALDYIPQVRLDGAGAAVNSSTEHYRVPWSNLSIHMFANVTDCTVALYWGIDQKYNQLTVHEADVLQQFGGTFNVVSFDRTIPAHYIKMRLHKEWVRNEFQGHLDRVANARSRL